MDLRNSGDAAEKNANDDLASPSLKERLGKPKFIIIASFVAMIAVAVAYSAVKDAMARMEYKKAKELTQEASAQSLADAVKWYRKSAEKGYAKAQYRLGECYASGNGVAKDMKEAMKWWGESSKKGYAPAMNAIKTHGLCK